jgi:hypothetical protein
MPKLSFSLPKYDAAINKFYNAATEYLHIQDDLLRRFPPLQVTHTGTTRFLSKPEILEAPYRQHKNTATAETEIITQTDTIKFKEFLNDLLLPIREKVKEHTIENINQICDVTGNKVDAVNQNAWDAYIEALEKMKIVFDADGNPNFLIHPPEFHEKLSNTVPTIEQLYKVEEIFQSKREEYYLKKQSRQMPKSNRKFKPPISNIEVDFNEIKSSFSLPNYDAAINRFYREVKDGLENLDPILGEIRKAPTFHGGTIRQVSEPQILETPMREYSVVGTIELEWFRITDAESFRDFLWSITESIAEDVKKHLFETVEKTSDAVGNSIDGRNKNLGDAYLEMLEKSDLRFDENGKHSHKIYALINGRYKSIEAIPKTSEQIEKEREIIERKRKEFYAQKRIRRLS